MSNVPSSTLGPVIDRIREVCMLDPLCTACGALVGFEEIFGYRQWEDQEPFLDTESPTTWNSLYRSDGLLLIFDNAKFERGQIVFNPDKNSPYRLSGIGRMDAYFYNLTLFAPRDRDAVLVDLPQVKLGVDVETIAPANFIDDANEHVEPRGYIIHADCWTLIERVIGPKAEHHIELFLQVLRTRWQENPFEVDHFFRDKEDRRYWYFPSTGCAFNEWLDPYSHAPIEYDEVERPLMIRRIRRYSIAVTRDMPPLWNPLYIPAVHDLLRKSVQNRARETMKRKTRKWSYPLSHEFRFEHLRGGCGGGLPPEIKWRILDELHYYKDVRNTLYAFGWQITDSYWRGRFPWDVVFEITPDLVLPMDIDWKFFGLKMEELLETSPSLQNRQRILRVLEGTKELFFTMLDGND